MNGALLLVDFASCSSCFFSCILLWFLSFSLFFVRLFMVMGNPSWRSGTSGYETAVRAAKIASCFLGILSFGVAARAAVPVAAGAVASVLPGFWASFRSWCAPPYLFVAVHFIIFVIWKLSDPKHHLHHHREEWAAEEHVVESGNPAKVEPFRPSHATPLLWKPSPEIWRDEISPSPAVAAVSLPELGDTSKSDASCLTTESGEGSTASSALVVKKRAEPEAKSVFTVEEDEDLAAAAVTAAGIENDSMDATWKAIMDKSSWAGASPISAAESRRDARQTEAPPSSTGHDELNRRIDDFIRRHHEQIRFLNGRHQL